MKRYPIAALIMTLFVLLSACQPACREDLQDDGSSPAIQISVRFQDGNGSQQTMTWDTSMPDPVDVTGYKVYVPEANGYSIDILASDGGGIASIRVETAWFALDTANTTIQPLSLLEELSFADCALPNRTHTISVDSHPERAVHYQISVLDFQDHMNGIRVLIVPEE